MANQSLVYNINNTDGTLSIAINPRTYNGYDGQNRDTDLTLFGNASPYWGEKVNENFIRLLENFAVEESSPGVPKTEDDLGRGLGINAPIEGQIWYNKTQGILFVYNGVSWIAIGGGGGGLDIPTADARYVNITGDTMTGFLTLHAAPTNNMHAATKQYVDASSAGFPTNTQMVFYQASAPTGWVQVSSITTTYALRVVAYGSSGGSSGGTDNPFTMDKVPSHRHVVSGNTGTGSPHNHNIYGSIDPYSERCGGAKGPNIRGFAGSTGSNTEGYFGTFAANGTAGIQNESSHAHAISITSEINSGASVWAPRYLDVIVARKA